MAIIMAIAMDVVQITKGFGTSLTIAKRVKRDYGSIKKESSVLWRKPCQYNVRVLGYMGTVLSYHKGVPSTGDE
ncbi:hypothetical protein AA106556_0448 [Neokomagataea tanensis NBRC 106556]|uniref:Transposase n=1 Tax=Neokomagataea tanensis NBRC 106556 TaxID=1223519 RepID=A0ABQ0QH32_9PROT|nr:hypothetical protein AA106556_0448 [Neokomagataea tanensis NBRC 106556]